MYKAPFLQYAFEASPILSCFLLPVLMIYRCRVDDFYAHGSTWWISLLFFLVATLCSNCAAGHPSPHPATLCNTHMTACGYLCVLHWCPNALCPLCAAGYSHPLQVLTTWYKGRHSVCAGRVEAIVSYKYQV